MLEALVDSTSRSGQSLTQLTNTLLMISPDRFGFNDQTASTNAFQNNLSSVPETTIRDQALVEFSGAVELLRSNGLEIVVCPSRADVETPDAVFPNNWISFHSELDNFDAVLYPMRAPNRRAERQFGTVQGLMPWMKIDSQRVLNLTGFEKAGQFLEGTGSLVFDRPSRVVFAHDSARTSYKALDVFCKETGYEAIKFHANDRGGKPIYHTNVVMAIGADFSVVCLEAIPDSQERIAVAGILRELQKDIIGINLDQLHAFCGNLLQVQPNLGRSRIIMSIRAFDVFTARQRQQLTNHGDIVPLDINTIETIGGGSARCMVAEVFPGKQ